MALRRLLERPGTKETDQGDMIPELEYAGVLPQNWCSGGCCKLRDLRDLRDQYGAGFAAATLEELLRHLDKAAVRQAGPQVEAQSGSRYGIASSRTALLG